MAVELAFAKSGEVLAAAQNFGGLESRQKFVSVGNGLGRVGRHRTRSHYRARCLERQIEHRSKVDVESHCAAVLTDDLAMLSEDVRVAGGECLSRRWSCAQRLAKTIDCSAFEVDAGEQRSGNAFLAIGNQAPSLLGSLDITGEENDTGGLKAAQKIA